MVMNAPRQSGSRAFILKALGIIFTFLTLAACFGAIIAGKSGESYALIISIVVGGLSGLLSYLASSAYIRGKKHLAPSVEEKLAQDTRPPVLYLRSFRDEALDAAHGEQRISFLPSLVTQEEELVEALEKIGPTVAIGQPNEPLPEVGAARMYVEAAQWKDAVVDMMGKACLVVIRAGESEGLLWEEEQVLQRMQPQQIVFILPDDAQSYRKLRSRLNPHLAIKLPAFEEWDEANRASLRAVLYFQPGWKPKMVDMAQMDVPFKRAVRIALKPVIDQLNQSIDNKGRRK
jgi:hypothetical protein